MAEFYYSTQQRTEQLFKGAKIPKTPQFVAEGLAELLSAEKQMRLFVRGMLFMKGDQVEFTVPGFRHFETVITDLHDAQGNKIDRAPNPMELLTISMPTPVLPR